MKKYGKFLVMIGVSTVIMFCMMYFNVYALDHIFFSQTRLFMALMMGAMMAIIMLLFMWKMYDNKKMNIGILVVSVVLFWFTIYGQKPNRRGRYGLDESHDSPSFDCDSNQ